MSSLKEQATFFRAALLLGLVRGDEVVRWADGEVARADQVPAALFEVAMTRLGAAHDLSALRDALQPLADERESPAVAARLLDCAARDFIDGRRNARDTITLLGQMRDSVVLTDELRDQLHPFGIQNMLASVGVEGSIEDVEQRLRDWLQERTQR